MLVSMHQCRRTAKSSVPLRNNYPSVSLPPSLTQCAWTVNLPPQSAVTLETTTQRLKESRDAIVNVNPLTI